ncbi:CCR4-NOT transcription complex subunit 10 [Arctopsyche grandis]|uniref:CCR4-NOT transcription complex subunit 10 n=1 Tax=Arctopsyche grandis TaxID=121162 RepID=UPI00406D8146
MSGAGAQSESTDGGLLALRAFKSAEYSECSAHLKALAGTNAGAVESARDRRIAFNLAVAEFYTGGRRDVATFRERLWRLRGHPWPVAVGPEESGDGDDVAAEAALHFSCALLLHQARQFAQARRLLERVAAARDRITDPQLASHSILLLMEVYLCCRMPDRVIALADQVFTHFQGRPPECTDLLKKLTLRAHLMNRRKFIPQSSVQSMDWLFLKAHQQYVNGNFQGAIATLGQYKQFQDLKSPNTDDVWAALNNNLGVLYSAMKKHNLSVKYMQQALREHLQFASENNSKINAAKDRPLYVFNLGVSLLKANRPEDAFECLVEATRHYPNNPRIWFRLAECCVIHYNKSSRQENIVCKLGSGPHAKLMPGHNKDKYVISGESYAIPTLTLEFAALCLMNATTLLPFKEPSADCTFQAGPSCPMNYAQYCDVRNSVLLLYSYVSLRLNDPTTTLDHCAKLLCHSGPGSPGQCALAHLYSAEALISLDRITEAIEHLNPTIINGFTMKMSTASQDIIGFAMWLNNAVCHAIRGDLVMARNILQQINSPRALPLQLYLEMCTGNIDNCRVLLRKFTRVPSQ